MAPGFIDIPMHEDPGKDGRSNSVSLMPCVAYGCDHSSRRGNCGINVYDPVKYLDMVEKDGHR